MILTIDVTCGSVVELGQLSVVLLITLCLVYGSLLLLCKPSRRLALTSFIGNIAIGCFVVAIFAIFNETIRMRMLPLGAAQRFICKMFV